MYQSWQDLLFLHWSVDPQLLEDTLPEGLSLDTFDGKGWVGIVPFFMRGVRPRLLPPVPSISNFMELNLRTYVVDRHGRPGVWFFSLDTSHRLPVWIAQKCFNLPYVYASMSSSEREGLIEYHSKRPNLKDTDEGLRFAWSRPNALKVAVPGSLEFFLLERYRLFAYNAKRGRLYTGKVHHKRYRYGDPKLEQYSKSLFNLNGFAAPEGEPVSILASPGAKVEIFPLERVQ